VATLSKVWVCGSLLSWDCRFESLRGVDICLLWIFCDLCKGLCNAPIPRPEDFYRVCVIACVIRCNSNPRHVQWFGRRGQNKKETYSSNNYAITILYQSCFTPEVQDTLSSEVQDTLSSEVQDTLSSEVQDTLSSEVQDTLSSTHRTVKPFWHMIRHYTSYDRMKLQDDQAYTLKKCYTHILCCNLITETSGNVVSFTKV
jgi:hypothetical protein